MNLSHSLRSPGAWHPPLPHPLLPVAVFPPALPSHRSLHRLFFFLFLFLFSSHPTLTLFLFSVSLVRTTQPVRLSHIPTRSIESPTALKFRGSHRRPIFFQFLFVFTYHPFE